MKAKKFIIGSFIITAVLLLCSGVFMAVIDPYFHFHKPLDGLEYPMNDWYYQNAGIAKQFDYNAAIVGDSMTQNMKPSQAESLWGYEFVKMSNSGATLRESDQVLKVALKENKNVKVIIRQLDNYQFVRDPEWDRFSDADSYLLDYNPFNDVKYLFEKETFVDALTVLTYTRGGNKTPTFDEYTFDAYYKTYGDKEKLEYFLSQSQSFYYAGETDEVVKKAVENVTVNVLQTAIDNPDVQFELFVPPYSGAYWKECQNAGVFDNEIATEYAVLSSVLEVPNIKVHYFMDDFDISTNWKNYSDELHFTQEINEYILNEMYSGSHLLTKENLAERLENVKNFYTSYDYNEMVEAIDVETPSE